MANNIKIKRALVSCWDKTGLFEFVAELVKDGIQIISSGGTAKYLMDNDIPVLKVEELTGFPEILDGRVKTLHPLIHGGILSKRIPQHLEQLKSHQIEPIDLVVVNLYPFISTLKKEEKTPEEMVELIDIGGPAMLRAAAKNFNNVVVLHQPEQYSDFLNVWRENDLMIPLQYSRKYAADAFYYTAYYDSQISQYIDKLVEPEKISSRFSHFYVKQQDLRYGENPHQAAARFVEYQNKNTQNTEMKQLWGKEMSFNNYVDVEAAWNLVLEFEDPTVAIIKHTNPCGVATADQISEAFKGALATDPMSAFGGIIAANKTIDDKTAQLIRDSFYECVIAPEYSAEAIEILKSKKNLRILKQAIPIKKPSALNFKHLSSELLVQEKDNIFYDRDKIINATAKKPSEAQLRDLFFSWKIVKHVKSNAIVFVRNRQLLGVGAGQMSRVDAVKLARRKALDAGHDLTGAVMASDAFFPFRDGVDEAAKAGIRAVIQPGGSKRDEEVIDAANEHEITMLFTQIRHFKH